MEYYQMILKKTKIVKKNQTSSKMLHLNTLARGPAHHNTALPEQALCGLGFREHHVAELDLSLTIGEHSVVNKNTHLDNDN